MINSLISYILGIIKITLYKILNFNRIYIDRNPKINYTTNFYINKNSKVRLGKSFRSRNNISIYCCDGGKINIQDNVFINDGCIISCRNKINIGSNCMLGNNVSIYDNDHDYKNDLHKYKTSEIEIGNNVWIGCNSVILKGSKIGNNSVIAAGTIVKGEIPDNTMVYTKRENCINKFKEIYDVRKS